MRLLLTLLFFFQLPLAMSQQTQTIYFTDYSLAKETSERKAVYKKTISTAPSGAITIEIFQVKNSQLISRETYNGKEPTGKWMITNASGRQQELDYDFQLVYTDSLCKADPAAYIDFRKVRTYPFTDSDSLNYIAPKFATGEKNMATFVNRRIVYPKTALQQELSGQVHLQLIIGQSGQIEALAIKKSANLLLDKEAMRIGRQLRFLNGASVAAVKKKVCAIVPITFVVSD